MKLFSGSIFLVAALAACCLLQLVQGAQMPHIRRSIETTSGGTSVTQLARRWWFGFSGSLGRVEGHKGEMVVVTADGVVHRHPAGTADTQRWLNYLKRKGVKFVIVEEGGRANQPSA